MPTPMTISALRPLRQLVASSSKFFSQSQRSLSSFSSISAVARNVPRFAVDATRPAAGSVVNAVRTFSVSARARGEGSTDVAFVQRLQEELSYEKEAASEEIPEFVKSFQAQGVWAVQDVPGSDEITLSRTFGNENIRMMFSIADLEQPGYEVNEEDENGEAQEQSIASVPIRCSFSITKSSAPGAINIDASCQDGTFIIENISYYNDAKLGTDLTAEADWKRRGLYIGPQFDQLDPGVQEEFEKFLEERGVDEALALFVPDYAEYKEQKEYVRWLENVKNFVEK